jgi:hypothetical protein
VLPSKQTLSNISKNGNICCHQCHLKYVQNFWENGKSKLPANFTCKHKVTSIGLKYDDRHAEIPKYWVPYMTKSGQITYTFTTKLDQEIGLSDMILSAVYLTCIRPDFETPDTRHADIKQSRNFHVVKKINRLIRSLRTFCHSVSSVLLLLCKAMQKSSKVHIF